MLAKVRSVILARWQRTGLIILLFGVVILAVGFVVNCWDDRERKQFGGFPTTQQLLDQRLSTLRSALSRLKEESTSEQHDRAFFVACAAMNELGQLHCQAATAVPLIVSVLSGPEQHDSLGDVSLRARAADALRHIGRPALEPVIGLLNHNEADVRSLAGLAVNGWAARTTRLPADIPMSDLQIAVAPIKEALSRERDEYAQSVLQLALYHVNREEALKLGISYADGRKRRPSE